jgi:hypothetical protein
VDPDSLYGDALDELPGNFDTDSYRDSYGEDPSDPAPRRQPNVERPRETERPDLRMSPPVERPPPAAQPRPDTSSTRTNPNNSGGRTAEEISEGGRSSAGN